MGHLAAPELHGLGRTALCSFVTVHIKSATVVFRSHWLHLFTAKLFVQAMKRGDGFFEFFFSTTLRIFKILSFTQLLCIKKDRWEKKNPVFTFFSILINCFYCLNLRSTMNMFSDDVKRTLSPQTHTHLLQQDRKFNHGSFGRFFFFRCNTTPGRRPRRMFDPPTPHGRETWVLGSGGEKQIIFYIGRIVSGSTSV